jgi:alpha-glucosidase (family GH31 glycosyl hydrolase)
MRSVPALTTILLIASACPKKTTESAETEFTLGSGSARVRVALEPFGFAVLNDNGEVVLQSMSGGNQDAYGSPSFAVDVSEFKEQLIPGWDGYVAHENPWQHVSNARIRSRTENAAVVEGTLEEGTAVMEFATDGPAVRVLQRIEYSASVPMFSRANKTSMAFVCHADEHFFGMGERYATVDHRGWSLYSWAEEAGVGTGEETPPGPANPYPNGVSMTYFPVPFFLSSRGYAVHLNTTFRSEVHFASERADATRVAVNDDAIPLTIYVGNNPLDLLDHYTRDTGRPVVPAPWVWGNRRRTGMGSTQEGIPEWQLMRNLHLPITGIDDATHFLPHRSELGIEDQIRTWTTTLHANGFKALAYYNPYVSASRSSAAEDFAYGQAHDLFIKDLDGDPALTFFISGSAQEIAGIDLTNPQGVAWFQSILARSLALGYDGWMHDFGEYTARDTVAFDGRYGDELHNAYPVLSAKAAHDFWQQERPNDYLFFVRSGYAGSQAYVPAVWSGDPEGSYDETQGLPSQVRGGVNLGMSGVPYYGTDMGGYKCLNNVERDKELYFRWLQLSALQPIMMDQNRCFDPIVGEKPKWTLWSDEQTWQEYGRYASFHTRLQPYFMMLAREANQRGTPLMRHPYLIHPQSPETWTLEDAYYLGPSLYVTPVVKRGQHSKQTWLPPGRFVDLQSYTVLTGGASVVIDAPITKLPLLLVENQMVPLLDTDVQTLASATEPSVVTADDRADVMDVLVALGPVGTAAATLVDGTTLQVTALAEDAGNPAQLTEVPQDQLRNCTRCLHEDAPGEVTRFWINTHSSWADDVSFGKLRVQFNGSVVRRVRFEVLQLP